MGMRDSLGLGSRFAFSCNVHATAVRWHPSCMMASYQQSTSSNTPRSTESLETLVQSLKATRGYKLCDFRETGDACIQYRDENNCIFHRCCRRGGCRDRSEFKNRTEQTSGGCRVRSEFKIHIQNTDEFQTAETSFVLPRCGNERVAEACRGSACDLRLRPRAVAKHAT